MGFLWISGFERPTVRRMASGVRSGEDLGPHLQSITAWLSPRLPGVSGLPLVTQYSGGASNWTYRLEYPGHDLVLRRPPAGTKAKSAHDMGREFRVQSALKPAFPYVPKMIGLCEDEAVLGSTFYVMERIAGIIPRANLPRSVRLTPTQTRTLCENLVERLIELHRVDVNATGLVSLGKGPGYAKRQIEGWSERFDRAKTWNVPGFQRVKAWLRANTPDDVAGCLIHNDYRFDNVVLDEADPTRVVGVLDWEMATVGDPLMDLGGSLAYWVQADDDLFAQKTRRQPTQLPGMMSRQELVAYYRERMPFKAPPDFTFYEVYGMFRLAGILQQIYYRYHHGQTRNPSFKHFWLIVHYFDRRCRRLIRNR